MSVMVCLEMQVKPERAQELTRLFAEALPDTRAFDGCIDITLYLADDGKRVMAVEHWETREKYEAYFAWRLEMGIMDVLAPLLDAEPSYQFFSALDA